MLTKKIVFFGQPAVLACDGRCDKAWGINSRPKKQFSEDPDDYVFLADQELGTAPRDPGTYEGRDGKPSDKPLEDAEEMNRWCARECERCSLLKPSEPLVVKDFANPEPNLFKRRTKAVKTTPL